MKIERCYDSHAHFLASSIMKEAFYFSPQTTLSNLTSFKPNQTCYYAFGWQAQQISHLHLDLNSLDRMFPDTPLLWSRHDGHAILVNSKSLSLLDQKHLEVQFGKNPKLVGYQQNGLPSGYFFEEAAFWVWNQITYQNSKQLKRQLLKSQDLWLASGFTHVRDMSGTPQQWKSLVELDQKQELKIFIIQNFEHFRGTPIGDTIQMALTAKKNESSQLRVGGVKIFLDGTLGASTAALSHSYLGCDHGGELLYSDSEVQEFIRAVFLAKLPICFHAIGNLGARQAIEACLSLEKQGIRGQMHLEHLEICDPEFIHNASHLDIHVHFQPSHWLSDEALIKQKLPPILKNQLFPWSAVEQAGWPYFFGFDSPVSEIGLELTQAGLEKSEQFGVLRPTRAWEAGHSHPDPAFGSGVESEFEWIDEKWVVKQITLCNKDQG